MSGEPFILGQQLAAAQKAEAERIAQGGYGPSPMGAGLQYSPSDQTFDLSNPVRNRIDEQLSRLSEKFAARNASQRRQQRHSLNMEDLYTLLTFAKRAAVFSLRHRDVASIKDGLIALAMIEVRRTDYRDVLLALGLLFAASREIGANPHQLFAEAASLAEDDVSNMMLSFRDRNNDAQSFEAWGYTLVEASERLGLIGRGYQQYHPTVPMADVIMDLAAVIRADRYDVSSIEIASELPAVWLEGVDDRALTSTLRSVVAGASLNGELRAADSTNGREHFLALFLVELSATQHANLLAQLAKQVISRTRDFALLPASEGRLFCLVVARNTIHGGAAIETSDSLRRFQPEIERVLISYSQANWASDHRRSTSILTSIKNFLRRLFR